MGCYFAPSDVEGNARRLAMEALDAAPAGSHPLLIGDLNANLDFPRTIQEEILSSDLRERDLRCATRSFRPRRTRKMRGRWTWRQTRKMQSGDKLNLRSKPDYFLMRDRDRRRVKRCRWILPRHHDSDHRALVVQIKARPGGVRQYIQERKTLPVAPPPRGP